MMSQNIEEQKKVAQFIRSLQEELEVLQRSQRAAGWKHRDAVIKHVYSDYKEQINVLEKKSKWEELTFKCNVIQGILKLLLPHRDIYGMYDIDSMKMELEELLKLAEKKEEYEMADLIYRNIDRFLYVVTTLFTQMNDYNCKLN